MKMYYYYGVMGSSKTANALMKKFSFEEHGKRVLLIKPSIDNRDGKITVKSRVGISCDALIIDQDKTIKEIIEPYKDIDIIIVDEAQFLTALQVEELRDLTLNGIMVMCYGLKTDYMGNLFEGSKRIIELADTIREIPSMCNCGKKAIMNARIQNDKIVYKGNQIDIGGNEKYKAMCYECWISGVDNANITASD